jgi:hypothetical protein
MRHLFLAAAALVAIPALAVAQTGGADQQQVEVPPAAEPLQLTPQRQAVLDAAVERGRLLALLDQAGRISTRDMLTRVADPEAAGIAGWVAIPEGNGVTVTYFAREGQRYLTVYRGQVLGSRVSEPEVLTGADRTPLTGISARMAAARTAVAALDHDPCGASAFNTLIIPPAEASDPIIVYEISPRLRAERVPVGGHYRTSVGANGQVGESTRLGGECADAEVAAVPQGERPRPIVMNARSAELPDELPVFISLWTGRPVVLATGTDRVRLWGVTGQGIGELRQ